MDRTPEFLAVGHVTKDLLPGGGFVVGGTATYSALTARGLGLSVGVLTSAPVELDLSEALPDVELCRVPSEQATTFVNIYEGEHRRQFVHGVADMLKPSHLPAGWEKAPIVLLGPLVRELGAEWATVFPDALVGVTPQGWMRQWNERGEVSPRSWLEAAEILSGVDVLVFSEADVCSDEALIQHYAGLAKLAVLTRGANGARLFWRGTARGFAAFQAEEVDPTGAGDVFAAAFLVRLSESGDPYEATHFANCTASFAIEGMGTSTLPARAQVQERLRSGRLRC